MDALLDSLTQFAFELSPDRMLLLAEKMALMQNATQIENLRKYWGPNISKTLYERFVAEAKQRPDISGRELATAFKTAAAAAVVSRKNGRHELIWTGPATSAVSVRRTEQALCELIDSAQTSLFLVSFVAYKAESVIHALRNAIQRNVKVCFLLEQSKEHGGSIESDSKAILSTQLPGARFYTWSNATGAVHAKCAVADATIALVTSANLTGKAMENNMELGVLVTGGTLPAQLHTHLHALITEQIIKE